MSAMLLQLPSARLPHDVEVERAVLGAVLFWGARAYERCSGLSDDDWALLGHRAIWRAMAGGALDAVGVAAAVRDDPDVGELGGPGYIGHLIAAACAAIQVGHHARTLRGLTRRRQRIERASEEQRAAYAGEEPLPVEVLPELGGGRLAAEVWSPGRTIPPRPWLLGTMLLRGEVCMIAGRAGAGKTALGIAMTVSLALGRALTGQYVHRPCRVLDLVLEDGRDEYDRRMQAMLQHHSIDGAALGDRVIVAAPEAGLVIAREQDGAMVRLPALDELRDYCRRHRVDAVKVDPFVVTYEGEENANKVVDRVVRMWKSLAIDGSLAVVLMHHVRKGTVTPGDPDAQRGGSASVGAVRSSYTMTSISDTDAAAFGIDADERRRIVRLDDAKHNLALGTPERWYRLASVQIDNGTDDYPAGDNVQAIEQWTPPSAWDGMSTTTLNAILDDIDAGMPDGERYSAARSAKTRAAWRVVQTHRPDLTEPQCRDVIRTWIANGVLVSETYHSSVTYRDAEGLRVEQARRPG